MNSILEELWRGDLSPCEKPYNETKRSQKLTDNMFKLRDELCETLDEKQIAMLEKYDNSVDEHSYNSSAEAFIKGFSLGVKIIMEAMTEA